MHLESGCQASWAEDDNKWGEKKKIQQLALPTMYFNDSEVKVAQPCLTLRDSMDYTVHGILQARILGVGSLSLLQGIFPTQGLNPGLAHCRWTLYQLHHKGSLLYVITALKKKITPKDSTKNKPYNLLLLSPRQATAYDRMTPPILVISRWQSSPERGSAGAGPPGGRRRTVHGELGLV